MTELVGTKEAVSILGCSLSAFKSYGSKGMLCPSKKLQGKNYFHKTVLENFSPATSPLKGLIPRGLSSGINPLVVRDIIEKWGVNSRDSGSADVQIGIYTEKIRLLEDKIRRIPIEDPEFRNMRYTLLRHVGERRKLLHYLEISDYRRYLRAMDLINKESRAA